MENSAKSSTRVTLRLAVEFAILRLRNVETCAIFRKSGTSNNYRFFYKCERMLETIAKASYRLNGDNKNDLSGAAGACNSCWMQRAMVAGCNARLQQRISQKTRGTHQRGQPAVSPGKYGLNC